MIRVAGHYGSVSVLLFPCRWLGLAATERSEAAGSGTERAEPERDEPLPGDRQRLTLLVACSALDADQGSLVELLHG